MLPCDGDLTSLHRPILYHELRTIAIHFFVLNHITKPATNNNKLKNEYYLHVV